MKDEIKEILSKEQALKVANFKDEKIHCFLSATFGLVGADHLKKDFMEELDQAESIEVGGEHCRSMKHALVLWLKDEPYFFEHNEDKLKKILEELL